MESYEYRRMILRSRSAGQGSTGMQSEAKQILHSGLIESLLDENEGELPVLSVSEVMLRGLQSPLPLLWVLTVPFSLVMALLGHPWIALAAGLANMTADWLVQRAYRRLAADDVGRSEGSMLGLLTALLASRATVAMSGPMVMTLLSGGMPELAFTALMACMLIGVATAHGGLSRALFWGSAAPVLACLAILIAALFPLTTAAVLLLGLALVAAMLALLAGSAARLLGDWSAMRDKNNSLIARLRAERALAEEAREEARLAGQAKANFLATMSHEIRTPMNGVLGMAQLLRRSVESDEQQRQVDTLIHSGEFLLSILNDILDISRIDAGKMELSERPEALRPLFEGLAAMWTPTADEKGLHLRLEITDAVPDHVSVDARRLRQVLFNLIGNAVKFTQVGGVTLSVDTRPLDDGKAMLSLVIRDTGIGIDPAVLPTLFERFSQVDQSTSRPHGGAGLGLSISRQLARLMDGDIRAESRMGEGASFYIDLPVRVVDPPALAEASPELCAPADLVEGLSVLIVDDNPVNLTVLGQILEAFGHHVTRASSGAEALDRAATCPFDLLLLDIQMPGMSGVEAITALRAGNGRNSQTPVLAVTADVLTRDRVDYLALGFSGFVSKPIQVKVLAEEIAAAMGPQTPVAAVA